MNGTDKFILEAEAVHGGKFNYDKVLFWNMSKTISIKCKKHGIFKVSPKRHLSLKCGGCPKCNRRYYQSNADTIITGK